MVVLCGFCLFVCFSEITNSYIYMLMECGNLDLNTWLRNRKTVNPLERKFYWKNMLEAVYTIHKHGSFLLCLSLSVDYHFQCCSNVINVIVTHGHF